MKKKTKFLLTAAGLTAASAATYYAISELSFTALFSKRNDIARDGKESDKLNEDNKTDYDWLNNSILYDVFIKSLDGLRLHGVKVVNNHNSNLWVIICHGYGHDHHAILDQAKHFDDQGYNILMIDQRSFGLSEGRFTTMAWNEHFDLLQWIDELTNEYPSAKVILYGVSMGATSVMLACGTPINSNVVCAIEDCGYNNLSDIIKLIMKRRLKIPGKPFMLGIKALIRKRLHYNLKEINCNRALNNCYVPMMFIHGEDDKFVPFENVFDNYYACNGEKELYTVENAVHATSYKNPEYYPRMFKFINRYL